MDNQLPIELTQLATNLRMQLGIPLSTQLNPIDIDFVTQCVNVLFVRLNPKWKPIAFQVKNQLEVDQAWKKLFKIVQSTLLQQGQTILPSNQEFDLQNIIMLYQVLCQGCQALRQQDPYLKSKNQQHHPTKNDRKQQNKPNKQPITRNNNKNPQNKSKQPQKQKSKSKSLQKQINNKQTKNRPQTASNANKKVQNSNKNLKNYKKQTQNIGKKLQDEIIQSVTKTMQKNYLTRAQPKRQAKIREKEGTQAVQKAKRTLDYAIKDYQLNNKLTNKKIIESYSKNKKKDLADHAYMKMIQTKHKRLNQQIQNQQLKYYMELRDKKVAYIRHIHKLIEKLQKERQIQFNKRQRQIQVIKKKQMVEKIQNVDHLFEHNMEKLHQNYQNRRKVQQLQNVGSIQVCRAMQKSMKQNKIKQIQNLQNLWNEERNQLHRIANDEQKMKNRLIEIYRKHRVQ